MTPSAPARGLTSSIARIAPLIVLLALSACDEIFLTDYPLPKPVSCATVLQLQLGDDSTRVRHLLGAPQTDSPDALDGADRSLSFGAPVSKGFTFRDIIVVGLAKDRIVWVEAVREVHELKGGPLLAYSLKRGPDGAATRQVGPAFTQEFDCGKGWTPAALPSDVTVVK